MNIHYSLKNTLVQYFNIARLIRVIAVASLFVGSLGFWIYIIMAIAIPTEPRRVYRKAKRDLNYLLVVPFELLTGIVIFISQYF